jgi:hypothetical protein
MQNHQILSSLPPLPEGGEVDGRVVVTDDSQESSLPETEAVESQRSTDSSEKDTESEQHFESSHSTSPPLATSSDGRRGKETMTKILAHPSSPNQLPKNLPRRNKMPPTPLPRLALLARKLLFFIFVYLFFLRYSHIFYFATILTELMKEQKKRNPQLMGQLLRAPPTRWFFPKNTVLLRKPRLPRSITQRRQLLCPSPER